jgi:GntR family transcriptional regulator
VTAPVEGLKRSGPDPLSLQVRDHLLDTIRRGVYPPGERLPSERVLARTLAVSRLTLRVALNELAAEGVVQASVGRGWFVTRTVSEPPGALMSFTRMVRAAGMTPSNSVIHSEIRVATAAEAEALGLSPGAELVDLSRIRLINDEPAAVEHARFVIADAAGLLAEDLVNGSLYDLMEQRGTSPTTAEFAISARVADERLAPLLAVTEGTPLLVLDQVTRDAAGTAFELVEEIYRVDRYRFRGAFHAQGAAMATALPELVGVPGSAPG